MSDAYVLHAGESRRDLGVFRVLVDGAEQDGSLAMYTGRLPQGGPALHSHGFDEAILIIEGRLLVHLDGVEETLEAGGFLWLPAGCRHTFANPDTTPVLAVGIARPDGLLPLFAERNAYLADLAPGASPSPEDMAAIYAAHASEVHGPPLRLDDEDPER